MTGVFSAHRIAKFGSFSSKVLQFDLEIVVEKPQLQTEVGLRPVVGDKDDLKQIPFIKRKP